jgi:hypothetical protein
LKRISSKFESISTVIFATKWFSVSELLKITSVYIPPDHLLLDRSRNIGPLIFRWNLDKFKNCWNKSFRTSKILTLLYQQFSNLLISQRDMSGSRLGALSNNRWSGGNQGIQNWGLYNVRSLEGSAWLCHSRYVYSRSFQSLVMNWWISVGSK